MEGRGITLEQLRDYMNRSVPMVCPFVKEVRSIQPLEFNDLFLTYTVVVDCEEDLCEEDLILIFYRVQDCMKFFGFDDYAHEVKISDKSKGIFI